MDSKTAIVKHIFEIVASRRVRAFSIGALVLVVLAVLQVNNLKRHAPMCELFSNSSLSNNDLQRIQIALSQSELSEYQLIENRLMVPTARHSEYLHAIAEQHAIPEELRPSDDKPQVSVNPFLSLRQQLAIDRAEKKQQIRDMVLRLPFVEQAWFEMDKSESHSAFEQAEQSAVISIRTPDHVSLSDQDVDTVKRMIGGAVAGLDSQNIVVIDLCAGFAHHDHLDPSTSQQVHFQRVAVEHQRFYENQIREILKDYTGIKVSVHVEVKPAIEGDHVASHSSSIPAQVQSKPVSPLPSAGANSFASIETASLPDSNRQATIQLVAHTNDDSSSERLVKRVSVSIDVPQQLVYDLFGPSPSSSIASSPADLQARIASDTDAKFERLRSEIVQKVRPILPQSKNQNELTPLTVSLIRARLPESTDWSAQAQEFAVQNWPSAAVLVIGLMLLSIVTRKPDTCESPSKLAGIDESGDILSIHSTSRNAAGSTENTEFRLSQLIEKDPDAAARVIEAWIRDAA